MKVAQIWFQFGKIHFLNRGGCLSNIFKGCTSLRYIKELKELQTANNKAGSYESLFENCVSLKKVPKLINFRILYFNTTPGGGANGTFKYMFKGCTKLIDATNFNMKKFLFDSNIFIPGECFHQTFYDCSSLKYVSDFYIPNTVSTINYSAFSETFSGCSGLIKGPSLNNLSGLNTIYSKNTGAGGTFYRTFYNCTSLTGGIDYLPSPSTLPEACYRDTFRNCSSLLITPQLLNLQNVQSIKERCLNSTFNSCTSIVSGIELPACALNNKNEYFYLYENCTNLKEIKVNFTNWTKDGSSTVGWVNNVPGGGKFICPNSLPLISSRS